VGPAAKGQVLGARRATEGERVQVVQLDLVSRLAATPPDADEPTTAPVAPPDLVAHRNRNVPAAGRRRLCHRLSSSTVSPALDAPQSDAHAFVQHVLQRACGQPVRQRRADRREIRDESRPDRHAQQVALRGDRLEARRVAARCAR
jgi:hypothetical protein